MFFYRAWAGNEGKYPQSAVFGPELFVSQFAKHRWGYAALLILTLLVTVVLNIFFLASFVSNIKKQKYLPHILFLFLSLRDLLVALILIPVCISWFVINLGFFEGDEILCKFTAFCDFFLAAEYPILLISLAIILYTRKYPKLPDRAYGLPYEDIEPMEAVPMNYNGGPIYRPPSQVPSLSGSYRAPPSQVPSLSGSYRAPPSQPPSVMGSYRTQQPQQSRPPYTNGNNTRQQRAPSAASSVNNYSRQQRGPPSNSYNMESRRGPSVAGSESGYRPGSRGFQPQRPVMLNNSNLPRKPGSVTGSIEGRMAAGRRVSQLQQQRPGFITSSPLREEDEDPDLWDELSMDYPGNQSPSGWEYLNEDDVSDPLAYEEPRFHTWHYWLLGLTWGIALAIGVPASMFVEYRPLLDPNTDEGRGNRKARPGCFIPADPFKNPYSYTVDDPGFNFTLSNLVITFILPLALLVILIILIYWRKITDNQKFRRYVKILSLLTIVFFLSRCAMDILQLKGIVEAAMGFKQLNVLPYQLEYEILLVWSTYLPLLANPVIYFCFCSEYRTGGWRTIRSLCGCPLPPKEEEKSFDNNYKEAEILSTRSSVSKTQKSNIL